MLVNLPSVLHPSTWTEAAHPPCDGQLPLPSAHICPLESYFSTCPLLFNPDDFLSSPLRLHEKMSPSLSLAHPCLPIWPLHRGLL